MNKISIKVKVILWYTIIMLAVSAASLFMITSVSQEALLHDSHEKIIRTVNDLSRGILAPDGSIRKMPGGHFFEKGVHIAIYDNNHTLLDGFIPFEVADQIPLTDDNALREKVYGGDTYLSYVKQVQTGNAESVWIMGILSISDETQPLTGIFYASLALTIIFLLTAAIGGYFILRHAFRPVSKISRTAKEISESSDLSQRISLGSGKDEIYQLANTFDDMLEKIEQTLEKEKQFTSDVSHELRTPVTVIRSECEYTLDCSKNLTEAKESVASIKRQSDKMAKLIEELLTFARMDRNTQQVHFEEVDISELLHFVCDEQEEIHEDTITLIRKITPCIQGTADHFLLTRMFINLIANSYQYGKEKGTITVSLTESETELFLSVADDGIGIAKEHLPKIWERFYQADPARAGENGSMGLGLSMVKWIAQCHGGSLAIESEPGVGTTITFQMPKKQR